MIESILDAPEGFHYRGMTPPSINSKLCGYIPEEKVNLEWKYRYDHLFTYNKDDLKDVNGKKTPYVRCTVCNKNYNQFFKLMDEP